MSQASPSKEPSMDEILASIRRIIESSDEKPGASLASNAARVAAADRAAIAQDTAAERPASFQLPAQAARVVPFAERAPATPPTPSAVDDADERWVPLAEPANSAGEPATSQTPSAGTAEAPEAEPAMDERSLVVEPVEAADRWTRELDDAETWTVLDKPGAAADAEVEPEARAVRPAEAKPEADSIADAEPVAEAPAPFDAEASSIEAISEPADADEDFIVDFDEADFVEALDRNAALVTAREPAQEFVAPEPVAAETPARQASPVAAGLPDRSSPVSPSAFAARAPLSTTPPKPEAAATASSVVRETSALMSEQAGTQVAAAFDDLARAIRDGQMKSMEDMAREMLRPMLQDWLDDNLPRLVERLVREEIERVSRGGRR